MAELYELKISGAASDDLLEKLSKQPRKTQGVEQNSTPYCIRDNYAVRSTVPNEMAMSRAVGLQACKPPDGTREMTVRASNQICQTRWRESELFPRTRRVGKNRLTFQISIRMQ